MRTPSVRPADAARRVAAGEAVLLDVREPFELEAAAVPGALHIPMQQVPERLAEVPKDRAVLVLCHHGMRSMAVAEWLRKRGYDRVENVAGGIDAWAAEVDPSVGSY